MEDTKFKRGEVRHPNAGRKKGTPNKFTDLKQAFLDVFEKIEEQSAKDEKISSLYKWAIKNPRNQAIFYQLISRMLPSNVSADVSGDLGITINRIITNENPNGAKE